MRNFILKTSLFLSLMVSVAFAENRVRLLSSDADALQARVDIIEQAEEEILVEYFSVWNDEQSLGGFSLLLDAARRGVKVKVLMDALSNKVPRALISALLVNGIGKDGVQNFELKVYNPLSLNLLKATHRDHAKMLVVDGRIMISGGRNVGKKYFGFSDERNYKDLDVILSGDVVKVARKNYQDVWAGEMAVSLYLYENAPEKLVENACVGTDDRYDDCERARVQAVTEYKHQVNRIDDLMFKLLSFADDKTGLKTATGTNWLEKMTKAESVQFLSQETKYVKKGSNTMNQQLKEIALGAQKEIRIISPYLIPTDGLYEVIRKLVERKVKITIFTNSLRSTDNIFAQAGYQFEKEALIKTGVEIHEFNGPSTLHAKAAIIDNDTILVGTYNLDPRSAQKNREIGFAIRGNKEALDDLNQQFLDISKDSTLVAKDQVRYNEDSDFKDVSKIKIALLKAIMVFVPLIKNQL